MPSSSSRSPAKSIAPPAAALSRRRKKRNCKGPAEASSPTADSPARWSPRAGRCPLLPAPSPRAGSGRRSPGRRAPLPVPPRALRGGAPRLGAWRGPHLAELKQEPAAQRLLRRAASAPRLQAARASPASQSLAGSAATPAGKARPQTPEQTEPGQVAELSPKDPRLSNGDHSAEEEPAEGTFPCPCIC